MQRLFVCLTLAAAIAISTFPGDELTVTGEISRKVANLMPLLLNGSVIEILPAEGPLPWADGPNRRSPKPLKS